MDAIGPIMRTLQFNYGNPVVSFTAAAVLSTVVAQHLSSRQSEVSSEALCWILLPILFMVANQPKVLTVSREPLASKPTSRYASSRSLWIVAVCVVTACSFKAEIGMIVLLPALSPLLLMAEKHLRPDLQAGRMLGFWPISPLLDTLWGSVLGAAFSILTLWDWNLWTCSLSVVPVAALLVVYSTFMPIAVKDYHFPLLNLEEAIVPLSLRVLLLSGFVLGIQAVAFGLPTDGIILTLSLGFTKALSWYFMTRIARYTSWSIAASITTFSILSTQNPFMQSSGLQALSHVIASFLALSQIIYILPKQTRARSILWVLILVSLVPYLANIFVISIAKSLTPLNFGHSQEHPVEALIHSARNQFDGLLQRQSQNHTAAAEEYRRRYGVEPPPGFDAWFEFAATHQSPIIDDYDIISETISPFWKLSGKEVIMMMNDVQNDPNSDLWNCAFSGGHAKTRCTHPGRTFDRHIQLFFNQMLGDLHGVLPDITFLVNHLDEPVVLFPPRSLQKSEYFGKPQYKITDLSNMPSWNAITKFCSASKHDANNKSKDDIETFAIPFITNRLAALDLCQHPEYSTMHGLFMRPTSFNLIEGFVPILTTGSPSTMGDILLPSPAYLESNFRYDQAHDTEWDKKKNNVYWAGSTTGGYALDDSWRGYQRQRFVNLAQNLEARRHSYLREKDGVVRRVKSSFLNNRLFDVAFTRILQCDRKFCRDQRTYFKLKSWADKDQALQSRLVFDIDGNGISGRYYKLLASKSVPLKQTLLREWHDDRLIPWVHYIPVSQGMEEIPELVFYLTSTEAGQARAREIADQGREWFSKAFRDIDLSIYTYRLALELARLQDPTREAS